MKKILAAAATVAIAASASSAFAQCDPGEEVIKFSHVVAATGHPKGEAAQDLAGRVNEEMNGKACMQVFPNSQLYDDDKVMEALLLGDVQIAAPSLSKFEAYTLKYRLFDLPFLFPDTQAVFDFIDSETGKNLLTLMEDNPGYVGLAYWINGTKHFSANRPLLKPEDAAGLKFRVQPSDVAEAMIEALGGTPQKLVFKEVYGALQTGVVDGQENSYSNIYTQKFFEVQDGLTETHHQVLTYLVVTSKEWLDGLPDDVREQFVTIMDETTKKWNDKAEAINEEAKQKILATGEEIRELTPEQRQAWVDAMKPVWDQFRGDIGDDLIEAAQAAGS